MEIGKVQASDDVINIINTDTKWTKVDSPYIFTEQVLVSTGVTLTIESGATINLSKELCVSEGATLKIEPGSTVFLNDYGITVNGTIIAQGNQTSRIHFSYGLFKLTPFSTSWDEKTGLGSIIEFADISLVTIESVSPKISNCSIVTMSVSGTPIISDNIISNRINVLDGSPIIKGNQVNGEITIDGSPTISGNTIKTPSNLSAITVNSGAPVIKNNTITGGGITGLSAFYWWELPAISISEGSSTSIINNTIVSNDLSGFGLGRSDAIYSKGQLTEISGNTIMGDVDVDNTPAQITGNIVYGTIIAGDSVFISNNTINWTQSGIVAGGQSQDTCTIANNRLYDSENATGTSIELNGRATVENNFVTGGIRITGPFDVIIRNNTIIDRVHETIGPYNTTGGGIYGSITSQSLIKFNNIEGGIHITSPEEVNASYNWWGTTNLTAINQTIYDFKRDFNLGTVNFIPFLTEPNPEAMPAENPTIPEFPSWIILPLFLVATSFVIIIKKYSSPRKTLL